MLLVLVIEYDYVREHEQLSPGVFYEILFLCEWKFCSCLSKFEGHSLFLFDEGGVDPNGRSALKDCFSLFSRMNTPKIL